MTERTDWEALCRLKTAVGSLPPVEPANTDRAQLASLGQSAGAPTAGAEGLPLDTTAVRDRLSRWELINAEDVTATNLFRCKVCGRISATPDKQCNLLSGFRPCREDWQKRLESEYARLEQLARLGVTLASSFLTWEMGSGAADHDTDDARMATCRALSKRIWHERGEVRPLDVERLVEAICQMVEVSDVLKVEDESLRLAYANAYMEPLSRADAKPAAIRALVLAALFGVATTTRPEGPQRPDESEARDGV